MLRHGTRHYVENVDADVSLLRVDQQLLPVVVARPRSRTAGPQPSAAVGSERSHYVEYTHEELGKRHPEAPAWLLALAFKPFSMAMRFGGLDRVVYINHWLLPTNPVACFTAAFVRMTLDAELLTYRAFRKEGSIDALKAWYIRPGVMTGALVGYDRSKPRTLGLYRQAMALQSASILDGSYVAKSRQSSSPLEKRVGRPSATA